MNWDKKEHNFGEAEHSTTQRVQFKYNGDKEVLEIEPLCNCVGYKFKDGVLSLTWKIKQKPARSYNSQKVIMITYKDLTIDDLTLKAFIKK